LNWHETFLKTLFLDQYLGWQTLKDRVREKGIQLQEVNLLLLQRISTFAGKIVLFKDRMVAVQGG
jgi:hypothetical protein